MNRMDTSGKYMVKAKDLVQKEIESKSVLLNLDNGNYYTLNRTGTFIWSLIDGKKRTSEIIEQVVQKFDVDSSQAAMDAETLIRDLENEGLIVFHNEPG